ncbi:MAG: Lrp/AsnC family transcriptional regulator [Candidatus Omnitrophica bacterium]|nr:Lrp/AsnC family transcriptional regulator [Candidatus Omnitrophota bacterium]MBI3010124.1 Lrp/AsnC family transcriptional regulator [Candidatus Omnitrophota bacterium]
MTTVAQTLDTVDKALLTEAQKQFPVNHRPFQILGERLGISEQECLERVSRLKTNGVIRQLSAIFDTRALGYQSTLAAMRVDPARADEAAEVINQHPGASHNYKRNDPFNLWFTVAVPPGDSLKQVVRILHTLARADETIVLPTLRLYKIGVKLDLTGSESPLESQEEIYDEKRRMAAKPPLTPQDIQFIRILQEDLPLLEMPYAVWAEQADATEEELFEWARRMEHLGYMRRFAAILHHRNAGFLANAMVVWQVPEDQVDAAGEQMARFREVSHCYRRPIYPNWPYPLFTMVHAPTHSACMDIVRRIEEQIGKFPHKNLFSTKEYKKVRVKYFTPELDAWWQNVGSRVSI